MEQEPREDDVDEAGPPEVDEEADDPQAGGTVMGAVGQLAAAVLAVGVLILLFFGSSAILRRIFG